MSPPARPTVHALMRSFAAMSVFLAAAGGSRLARDCALAGNWRPSKANAIVADAIVETFLGDMGISFPPADYRGPAELRAHPYFKASMRSFASSIPPACARSYNSRAFVGSPEIPRACHDCSTRAS